MTIIPKFCHQCGHPLEPRHIEDRLRQVCSNCHSISYQNPLPVAAVVLLNEKREVLLVKRKNQPRRGMWCLPMGFAELDETIAQAALRELEEEAGVQGRIVRLLAAKSAIVEMYGDLLIVTFEAAKTGGIERSGDDAEALKYFPVYNLPVMAFDQNRVAINYCIEQHREDWAIHDSYRVSEEESPAGMLSDHLIAFVRDNAGEVTERWLRAVVSNETTTSYSKADHAELRERVGLVFSQLTRWISGSEADAEVQAFYRKLGSDRREQGFKLHEIISSLTLLRKQVLLYAREKKGWGNRTVDLYTLIELDRRNYIFFDKAIYHTARGFYND